MSECGPAEEMSAVPTSTALRPSPAARRDRRRARGEAVVLAEGAGAPTTWTNSPRSCGARSTARPRSTSWRRTSRMCSGPSSRSCGTTSSRSPRSIGRAGLLEGIAYEAAARAVVRRGRPASKSESRSRRSSCRTPTASRSRSPTCASDRCSWSTGALAAASARGSRRSSRSCNPSCRRAAWRWCSSRSATRRRTQPLLEEHGLHPRVLLGDGLDVEVFAGVGTPSAYLVDAEGKAAPRSRSAPTRSPTWPVACSDARPMREPRLR